MTGHDSIKPTYEELERRVRELEARDAGDAVPYRTIYEHIHHEVHVWELVRDADGQIRTWRLVGANPPALRSWGETLDEAVGKTAEELFPESEPLELFMPIVRQIFATGEPRTWEQHFPYTGQILEMTSIPLGDRFISTGTDVTERRQREARLRGALDRLREASRAGGVGLWELDLETSTVYFSDEWKAQLGWTSDPAEKSLSDWLERVHPDDRPELEQRLEACAAGRSTECETAYRLTHPTESARWFLCHGRAVAADGGNVERLIGSQVDITERRRLEERARSSEQLRSLGMLAGGIGHDFNNLLMAMLGNVSLAKDLCEEGSKAAQVLEETETVVENARALTNQLMTFSEGGAPVRKLVSLREIIADSARFVSRGSAGACLVDMPDDLADAEVDPGQISQVISNLVINAFEATDRSGRVEVRASNLLLTGDDEHPLPAGRYVRVSVRDDGPGIPEAIQARVFEPYFTTKDTGTGLGLAICHSIVDQHGGAIGIDVDDRGTTVHFCLPASGDRASRRRRTASRARAGGYILVMDDDPIVLRAYDGMLKRLGYSVTCCPDGNEAVEHFAKALERGSRYDAVILDLTVPGGMGGEATLARLRELDPGVRALIASGYSETSVNLPEESGRARFLQKPFNLVSLDEQLRRMVAED